MFSAETFTQFIERIRRGDDDAARELVQRFESVIRREARLRLHVSGQSSIFDSMDITQSVLGSFFAGAAQGQYELREPEQLAGLLIGIVRKKVASQARKQRAQLRDSRRTRRGVEEMAIASNAPGPSQVAAEHDLVDVVRRRLSQEEQSLADLRAQGCEWAEIAERLGGTPYARRMQLARAAKRLVEDLEPDERIHAPVGRR